jgi:hypothetical protein
MIALSGYLTKGEALRDEGGRLVGTTNTEFRVR